MIGGFAYANAIKKYENERTELEHLFVYRCVKIMKKGSGPINNTDLSFNLGYSDSSNIRL